jgi:NitT/TauT family transport system permease protein
MSRTLDRLLLPLSLVAVLAVWEVLVRVLAVPQFILPPPSRVMVSLTAIIGNGLLLKHFLVTLREAIGGFVLAGSAAIVFSVLITHSRIAERILYPYFTAIQAMPKIALAPLVIIWFGYGFTSKLVLAGLLAFFPMLVNFVEGLRSTDPGRLRMMRAMDASRWQVLRYVRVPYALPFVLAGIEIGGLYAMLGAIVGEFVGSSSGIGNWLMALNVTLDTATTFALLLALAAYGVLFQKLIVMLRRRALFWARNTEPGQSG